jgi:hypothetical protein
MTRYTMFREPYGPGYAAFETLIRGWRDAGGLGGLEFTPEAQAAQA